MEELYENYALKIYKYIYSLCGNHDITEEILQETFYSAIKNIKQFKNQSSIYTWLCVIAKNKWKDYIKKNKKSLNLDEDKYMKFLSHIAIVNTINWFNKNSIKLGFKILFVCICIAAGQATVDIYHSISLK